MFASGRFRRSYATEYTHAYKLVFSIILSTVHIHICLSAKTQSCRAQYENASPWFVGSLIPDVSGF